MKFFVTIFILYFTIYSSKVLSQHEVPDTVKIGSYVTSLYNFDIANNSICADIHLWCLYNDTNYNFEEELEFINCEDFTFSGTSTEDLSDGKWFYTKSLIKIRQKYSTKNYPFDKQKIIISIESSEHTTKDFVFKPDIIGSRLDSSIYKQFDEWEIESIVFSSSESKYETSFGDPSLTSSSYPRFDIIIVLNRIGSWLLLFKLITGILVAFLISSCVFCIKPKNTDPRFGLCVGGLFAAIGNKYIVESIIPSTNELTLLDYLHNITFIAIFVIIIISVISLHIYEKEGIQYKRLSKKIDSISYFTVTASYITIFIYLIFYFK